MRRLIPLVLAFGSTLFAQAQEVWLLPRDNGDAVSFCESIVVDSADFNSIRSSVLKISYMRLIDASDRAMMASMRIPQMGYEVTGRLTIYRKDSLLNYCFQDYRVDDVPLDRWITASPSVLVTEQIKSTVFSNTVLVLAEIKQALGLGITAGRR